MHQKQTWLGLYPKHHWEPTVLPECPRHLAGFQGALGGEGEGMRVRKKEGEEGRGTGNG